MKVWSVTASRSNEFVECEVFATEQQGLEGYLEAMNAPRKKREHLIRLYWDDINAFDEWVDEYLEDSGDMYALDEHNLDIPDWTHISAD